MLAVTGTQIVSSVDNASGVLSALHLSWIIVIASSMQGLGLDFQNLPVQVKAGEM